MPEIKLPPELENTILKPSPIPPPCGMTHDDVQRYRVRIFDPDFDLTSSWLIVESWDAKSAAAQFVLAIAAGEVAARGGNTHFFVQVEIGGGERFTRFGVWYKASAEVTEIPEPTDG